MTAAIPLVTGKQFPTTAPLPAYAAIPERTVWTWVAVITGDSPEDLERCVCERLNLIESTPLASVVLPFLYLGMTVVIDGNDFADRFALGITYRAAARIEP